MPINRFILRDDFSSVSEVAWTSLCLGFLLADANPFKEHKVTHIIDFVEDAYLSEPTILISDF